MNKIIIALISVSLLLTCSCGAPAPPESAPQPPPTITEPEPVGPNMKIVAAELSWAQKYMEDFVFEYPIITDKTGLTEYERPLFYKWGYTDSDFPVQTLRIYEGGTKYYLLSWIPASNILEAKGNIENAVKDRRLISSCANARSCLQQQKATSYSFERWLITGIEESSKAGTPKAYGVTNCLEEYRGELHQIILRLEAAEAELEK